MNFRVILRAIPSAFERYEFFLMIQLFQINDELVEHKLIMPHICWC